MDFELSETAQDLQARLLDFVQHHTCPAEQVYRDRWPSRATRTSIRRSSRS